MYVLQYSLVATDDHHVKGMQLEFSHKLTDNNKMNWQTQKNGD